MILGMITCYINVLFINTKHIRNSNTHMYILHTHNMHMQYLYCSTIISECNKYLVEICMCTSTYFMLTQNMLSVIM